MKYAPAPRTRREFLAGMAGTALVSLEARTGIYNPQLAVHTLIWMQQFQLHGQSVAEGSGLAFSSIHRAGYTRVELAPEFTEFTAIPRTTSLLEKYNLAPVIIDRGGSLRDPQDAARTRADVLEHARAMKPFGAQCVAFRPSRTPAELNKTDEQLEFEAAELRNIAGELRAADMRLVLSHHLAEMRQGAREWRYRMRNAGRMPVLCVDVESAHHAGLNPLDLLNEAGGMLGSVCIRNTRHGIPLEEVAEGDIDLAKIASLLRKLTYDGYLVVDLQYDDRTMRRHSLDYALTMSRWYMQEVFGTRPGSRPVDMGPHVRPPRT